MWFSPLLRSFFHLDDSLARRIRSFSVDSRKTEPGGMFFALPGEKVDGHDYLCEAEKKGALAAVVDQNYRGKDPSLHLIRVVCVQTALQELARKAVALWNPFIIGITGSVGKTSTKDFLSTLLEGSLSCIANPGNQNSQLGLPLTVLNVSETKPYLLLEMGIDRPGELDALMRIAPPDFAVLTMLAHSHIARFESFESLAREKMKIFSRPETKMRFYNRDMPFASLIEQNFPGKTISYSLKDPEADYHVHKSGRECLLYKRQKFHFRFVYPLPDESGIYNLLSAVAVADQMGISADLIRERIPALRLPKGRLEQTEVRGVHFINDAYNANVESVVNALRVLGNVRGKRRVAVLSELVEQGKYSSANHERIVREAFRQADCLIGIGAEISCMISLGKKYKKKWAFFLSYDNMKHFVRNFVRKGDVVLLKGANRYHLENLIHDFTVHPLS